MLFQSISENAMLVQFPFYAGLAERLNMYKHLLEAERSLAVNEVVLGYSTMTIYFNPFVTGHNQMKKNVQSVIENATSCSPTEGKHHHIPVCYDRSLAPDLDDVLAYHTFSLKELIALHSEPEYKVAFLGFSPGFPFLSGMQEQLATPRKEKPRLNVPVGSVGIAGLQTGIYPSSSPGGWQIIGRTPINLLPLQTEKPTLFEAGDRLSFYPITPTEFEQIMKKEQRPYVD
ncbi:5-oxoprolinase subunit PxpB [Gracilibacillus caseinilyticus]|uniref:5-oxoprolinase subunit PxpB n=1 Tax=Gracilibacillus caseinilyticus TaxID=2932256 RepID=A0ABY4EXH7_9BACI|nr:5-oxoprolinase subunit PxpB [Gracilibacillus caseinilyticus]UOQ48329.1 5-oxoprolinase subunit PxpB [Gracilibacillus caseinilyticus]